MAEMKTTRSAFGLDLSASAAKVLAAWARMGNQAAADFLECWSPENPTTHIGCVRAALAAPDADKLPSVIAKRMRDFLRRSEEVALSQENRGEEEMSEVKNGTETHEEEKTMETKKTAAKKTAAKKSTKKTAAKKPAAKKGAPKGERKNTSKQFILDRLAKDGFKKERPPKEWAEKVAAEVRKHFEGRTTQASDIYFVFYRQNKKSE